MTVASWLELSERAYLTNIATFRKVVGQARVGVVLKGNAYGHGLLETLAFAHGRVDVLYVITPGEALRIRAWEKTNGMTPMPVLVLGTVDADDCLALAREKVSVVLADRGFVETSRVLRAANLSLEVHVHLDTGLGREGFTVQSLEKGDLDFLAEAGDVLRVRGVLSHFANTEDVTEQDYARLQLANFEKGMALLRLRAKVEGELERHFAASAAALVLPPARYDVVRIGIAMYGLWPSTETRLSTKVLTDDVPVLEPVLSWKTPSQVIKWLPAGSYVGYGCTWRCAADTRVAVLPVGYWDGYPRLASGKAHVLINGRRCAVIGRVMMNHLIVDVTHAVTDEAQVTATLLGRDGDESISAELISGWAQTIHYETMTRLGAHLRRLSVP